MRSPAILVALALLSTAGCTRSDEQPRAAGALAEPLTAALRVPVASGPIKLDGELDEPSWNAASARTGAFVDAHGDPARPYSDARFLWDAENLYVALYAADDDIHARVTSHDGPVWTDDAFSMRLAPAIGNAPTYAFDISAAGVVMDARRPANAKKDDAAWESGIKLGVDRDGTPNDSSDDDEEWVIEAAIPLASIGLSAGGRAFVEIGRCDTPKGTKAKRCGSFGTAKERRVIDLVR